MNRKIHILFTFVIVSLILIGCDKNSPTNMPQQNEQSNLVTPASNSEITRSPEDATPTITILTSDTTDYNQYIKKTWIMNKDNNQENRVSFTIFKINNNKITGELTIVGSEQSCPNTVADLSGTINNDTAECYFTDSRENEGSIKLIFKPNNAIDATIILTSKSDDDIAQPLEGTFQFTPLNLKNEKDFSPIEDQSFMVDLNSWGMVRFVSGKFSSDDYVPIGFYLTDEDGDVLYNFNPTITYKVDIKAVSFKDVNKDELKDIIIIASNIENSDYVATIYLQETEGTFRNDANLDQEINDSGSNKDIKAVTNYLSQNQTLVLSPSDSRKSVPITINHRKIEELPELAKQINKKEEIAPKDWSLLDYKENDFNEDGLNDIVGVIEHQYSDEIMYPRILFIYFNNGNGYSLYLMNPYIIRNCDEGGVFGDPYEELSVYKNTFTTNAYGGSAWRWSENLTYEYKSGDWFLLSAENWYGYGDFETIYSYDDYNSGKGFRRVTEDSPEKENPEKLEYDVKLDKQPLLKDYAYPSYLIRERIQAPDIKSVCYNADIKQFDGNYPELSESNILGWNNEYIIYKINQTDEIVYIGVLSLKNNNLQMIARYDAGDQEEEAFSDLTATIYNDRLYYVESITKMVPVRSHEIVSDSREVIAVQLISMKLDGTDKKVVFRADHSKYEEGKIVEGYLDYITLEYVVTGDEIIVMVYGGDNHPYYRMNLQGEEISLIGSVPEGGFFR